MFSSSFLKMFATPVSYGLVIILVGTALMQVHYLNKALQRFDSTQVIPIQFVLFTLSVIIGSAVLYRDFERTTLEQAIKFVGGCLLTFFGVFLISSGRPRQHNDDRLSDDENSEVTIGLRDQEGFGPYNSCATEPTRGTSTHTMSASTSRRSSRTSRGSFPRGGRAFRNQQPTIITPNRNADQPDAKSNVPTSTDTSPFLLNNPWRNSVEDQPARHPGPTQTISADSIPTIHSVFSIAASEPQSPSALASRSHSHHHYSNAYISTLPLSSTVSVAVADTLLRREDNPTKRRSAKRLRPNIRSSLFVSPDDDIDAAASDSLLIQIDNDDDTRVPNECESPPSKQEVNRGRARSLSNTIGQFFVRKKRRRGESNPENGGSQSNPSSDHERQEDD